MPQGFYEQLELTLLKNAHDLSAKDCVALMNLMTDYGSTEIFECFDRVIGAQIDTLSPKEIVQALVDFKAAQHAQIRPKIINLLTKRVEQVLDQVTSSELTYLTLSFSLEPHVMETLRLGEHIAARAHSFSHGDLCELAKIYNKSSDVHTREVVEQRLI